jgi:hypothetical protein
MAKKIVLEILLVTVITGCSQSCDQNTNVMAEMPPHREKLLPELNKKNEPASDLKTRLTAAITNLRKREKEDQDNLSDTPEEMIDMACCKDENSLLDESANSQDKRIVYLSEQLKREMEIYQLTSFPKLRKHFQIYLKEIDSHINIDVQLSGSRNTELTFIGAPYAPEEDTKPAMDLLNDQVSALRFKTVNFKWVQHDAHCTTYKIDSPGDDVIQ